MSNVMELMERFLDDRHCLSEDELEQLVMSIRRSPELSSQLQDQLIMDEMLAQQQGIDRQDFLAQVAQRIRDLDRGEEELLQQVEDMRALAAQQYEQWLQQSRRRRTWRRLFVAAAVLLIAGGTWLFVAAHDTLQVVQVYGAATLIRDEERKPLKVGTRIRFGDRIWTAQRGMAVLTYDDGTQMRVSSNSMLELASRLWSGKSVKLTRGALAADVAPQPRRRPMRFHTPQADAEVLGTTLLLRVSAHTTQLDVGSGRVQLTGLGGQAPRVIASGESGFSDGRQVTVKPLAWPSRTLALQLLMDPTAGRQQFEGWETRGEAEITPAGHVSLAGGAVELPKHLADQVTSACQASGELTVEVVLRADSLTQGGPARIVSLSSSDSSRNFTLGQEGSHLILRLRTPQTSDNAHRSEVRLCKLPDHQPHHLLVAYRAGELAVYFDGQRMPVSQSIRGDFSNWSPQQYLMLGDERNSQRRSTWRGELRGLAVYSRFVEGEEALRNAAGALPLRSVFTE